MRDSKYKYTLYLITVVIISTIGIQTYWNYKNYLANKQQLIKDVQTSLDKAVDDYYSNLAQSTTMGFIFDGEAQKKVLDEGGFLDEIAKTIDEANENIKALDSLKIEEIDGVKVLRAHQLDSIAALDINKGKVTPDGFKDKMTKWDNINSKDSIKIEKSDFEVLTSKIVISIKNDSLDLKKVDSLLKSDLARKNINLDYTLEYNDSIGISRNYKIITKDHNDANHKLILSNTSMSTFLPKNSELKILYENENWVVLQKSLSGIVISTLLVLAVISCLFYLLKIIRAQKQLAEVKNDLISNITHEFKTPISTIGVALESIKDFDGLNDKVKTEKYLEISGQQLSKLNNMVEKLLETATLDSSNLELEKELTNISNLLETLVDKYKMQYSDKVFLIELPNEAINVEIDIFHFENAINNLLDNAVKYGGKDIKVKAEQNNFSFNIFISDSGIGIPKNQKDKVFEKFYRIPHGNTHDVKGFGIGLYYTKTIVEKHGGAIHLDLKNKTTSFKITIPK